MTGRGVRLAAGALAGVLGIGLLMAAQAGRSPDEPAARDSDAPETIRAEPQATSEPTTTDPGSAESGTRPPPAATATKLPPQWPEFTPSRVRLRPDLGPAPVDPVAVDGGTLALPVDADRVGWWRGGSLAGAPFGTVVLAGHLDSDIDPAGYLAGLSILTPGDLVELTGEDDRQAYRVTRNFLLPRASLSARSDLFEQQRRHRLVLITCGGDYDAAAGAYQFNRIVVAEPVV